MALRDGFSPCLFLLLPSTFDLTLEAPSLHHDAFNGARRYTVRSVSRCERKLVF
ncbi:hypothetical protein RHGRI_019822 [Rhododendron griersonianum]|uniref:Uncharacterized protein n=1 Tax=Rhododendron griersonianum TaxID=479676 RepID=A0AAV6JGW4_9ERIC|nr:hypothetical protein RHGRI_019822 [Rhododendron griersonianum]